MSSSRLPIERHPRNRELNHVRLMLFASVCLILSFSCNVPFKSKSMRAKLVPVFCIDGQVKQATVYSYRCTSKKSACNVDAYPNFYTCNEKRLKNKRNGGYRITNQQLFQHSTIACLGGGYAFARIVLDNMSHLLQ